MTTPTEQEQELELEQKRASLRRWIPEDKNESATRGKQPPRSTPI